MAKAKGTPQLENGFARVANEILEAIARTALSDHESRCIHFLWRKTYGWQDRSGESKKLDSISHSQWATGTDINRRHVHRVLERLVQRNIIVKVVHFERNRKLILWGFQKKYHDWLTPLFEPSAEPEPELPPVEVTPKAKPSPVEAIASLAPSPLKDRVPPVEVTILPPVEVHTKDKKDTKTKDLLPLTEQEKSLLDFLKGLRGWSFAPNDDITWLREFLVDCGPASTSDFKACRDYYSGRVAPHNKGPWKNRFRNWLSVKRKMGQGTVALKASSGRRPGSVPTEEELDEQALKKGVA